MCTSPRTTATRLPLAVSSIAVAAAAWITVLAGRSPVPSEDGASYLWIAQQFASGRGSDALASVFPPGLPLLLAPLLWLGCDPIAAAAAVGALSTGLTIAPLWRLAEWLHPGSGFAAALLFASGSLLARVAAEVYSEPPFLLLMAWGTWFGVNRRYWAAGAAAGAAFWVRPEGLLLAAALLLARRAAWPALVPALASVVLFAGVRWCTGSGFDALPILAFHEQRDDLPDRGRVFANLLRVPGAWLEAYGPTGLLACAGCLLCAVRAAARTEQRALTWMIVLNVAAVCTFVVRRRFLLSCAVPVTVFAAAASCSLPSRWRRMLLAGIVVYGAIANWRGGIDADRLVEREIGEHLAGRLAADERLVSDLARVAWFAGQKPLPPRHFSAEQLAAMAAPAAVRFVVVSAGSRRESARAALPLLAADFAAADLPEPLGARCAQRGIAVLVRR